MDGMLAAIRQGSDHSDMKGWRTKPVKLRYSLSYVKLFELTFKALEDSRPFEQDRPPLDRIDPPVEEVPPHHDAVIVRNQPLTAEIPIIDRLPGMLRYAPRQLMHFYTDLRGGSERCFGTMSSKTRSTLIRKVRSYEKSCGGRIPWRVYKTPDEMLEYCRLAREIAKKTYQERLFDASLPDSEAFQREMMKLAERDLVRGFLLFHESGPVAYLYTPAPDGFLVYEYLGYDPAFASYSPGTVLQYLALKDLYEEGRFPLYYWGYGYSQTKQIFSTGRMLAADIYYFRPTLRNYAAVWLHYGTDHFSATVGAALDRVGMKRRIKRWLKTS